MVIVSFCVVSASVFVFVFVCESVGISDVSDVDDVVIRVGDVVVVDEVVFMMLYDVFVCIVEGVVVLLMLEEFRYVLLARISVNEDMCRCFFMWSCGVGVVEEV